MLCRIGEVEVWRVLEINGPYAPPDQLFPTAGADVAGRIEALAPGSICPKSGGMMLPVQGFLLKTPDHIILVDACVGNHKTIPGTPDWHQRTGDRFMAGLKAAGVGVEEVDYVLCTHLHTDHVGWNTQLKDGRWVPTFPNARYLMPDADEALHRQTRGDMYVESVLPVIEAGQAEMVEAGHMLGDHVALIPTPGHTPGHVSVAIRSGGAEAIITGDALHTTAQCWHPEWHFKYDADAPRAVSSRRFLLETCVSRQAVVLGSHFLLPSLGRITEDGEGFAWVA